jgi:hypothetical protein
MSTRRRGRPTKHTPESKRAAAAARKRRQRLKESIAKAQKEHHDLRGRLPGEFSGGIDGAAIDRIRVKHNDRGHRRTAVPADPYEQVRPKETETEHVNTAFRRLAPWLARWTKWFKRDGDKRAA